MSDTWYRDPLALPPYEDGLGNLWAMDGTCVNAVHTCEPPAWYDEMVLVEMQAELMFSYREALDRAADDQIEQLFGHRPGGS